MLGESFRVFPVTKLTNLLGTQTQAFIHTHRGTASGVRAEDVRRNALGAQQVAGYTANAVATQPLEGGVSVSKSAPPGAPFLLVMAT